MAKHRLVSVYFEGDDGPPRPLKGSLDQQLDDLQQGLVELADGLIATVIVIVAYEGQEFCFVGYYQNDHGALSLQSKWLFITQELTEQHVSAAQRAPSVRRARITRNVIEPVLEITLSGKVRTALPEVVEQLATV
jgi:hypothetical protein